jgi:hypothetical protein
MNDDTTPVPPSGEQPIEQDTRTARWNQVCEWFADGTFDRDDLDTLASRLGCALMAVDPYLANDAFPDDPLDDTELDIVRTLSGITVNAVMQNSRVEFETDYARRGWAFSLVAAGMDNGLIRRRPRPDVDARRAYMRLPIPDLHEPTPLMADLYESAGWENGFADRHKGTPWEGKHRRNPGEG